MTRMSSYEETRQYQDFKARQERKKEREEQEKLDKLSRKKKYTEKQVDNSLVKVVTESKGFTTKMHPISHAGIPDRLIHFRRQTIYVEIKKTGGECTPLQIEMHKRLKAQGIEVFVLDTVITNIWDLWVYGYTTYEGKHYAKNPHKLKT